VTNPVIATSKPKGIAFNTREIMNYSLAQSSSSAQSGIKRHAATEMLSHISFSQWLSTL